MTINLTTIHLVGSLGRRFGETWTLDVTSTAEAIRAIDINTRGAFSEYLRGPGAKRYYKIALGESDKVIPVIEGTHRSGRLDIWIIPTIRGGDSSAGKIIAGVALLALAWWNPAFLALGTHIFGSAVTVGGLLVSYGVALTLGGIAQALTPNAQGPTQGAGVDENPSKVFQGNSAAIIQGECVPVIYGRALVPAFPISISLSNDVNGITEAGFVGSVTTTTLEGGGVQYTTPPADESSGG